MPQTAADVNADHVSGWALEWALGANCLDPGTVHSSGFSFRNWTEIQFEPLVEAEVADDCYYSSH